MAHIYTTLQWHGKTLKADLQHGHCIAIPLESDGPQPNAWYAPLYEASPHQADGWIGDTREGAPVNFYNLRLNPHGNGTHTECVGHITKERHSVHEALKDGYWIAQLISVYPVTQDNGDKVINTLEWQPGIEALILRTEPNHPDKMSRHYGGTNPPYLDAQLLEKMAVENISHLLLDLPSVDREEDEGKLAGHRAFWKFPEATRLSATITEMIFVDSAIPDGLYLLQIQMPALQLDAAPSRPFIYPLV